MLKKKKKAINVENSQTETDLIVCMCVVQLRRVQMRVCRVTRGILSQECCCSNQSQSYPLPQFSTETLDSKNQSPHPAFCLQPKILNKQYSCKCLFNLFTTDQPLMRKMQSSPDGPHDYMLTMMLMLIKCFSWFVKNVIVFVLHIGHWCGPPMKWEWPVEVLSSFEFEIPALVYCIY